VASRTALPADSGLAPRKARPIVVRPIPAYPDLAANNVFGPDRAGGAEEGSADDCTAVGVSIVGRDVVALIRTRGALQSVRVGQKACGGDVSQIARNTIELVQSGRHRMLVVGKDAPPVEAASQPQGPESAE
jgi:hypothetical protein